MRCIDDKKMMNWIMKCIGHRWWVGHLCGRSGRTC